MGDPVETDDLHKIATRRRTRLPYPDSSDTNGKSAWFIEPDQTPGFVTIRNVELKQYLTTIDNCTRDAQRRNVFTSTETSAAAVWAIEPVTDEEQASSCRLSRPTGKQVRIKNQLHGEYLYAAADDLAIDRDNRNIFTWIDEKREPAADWNPSEYYKGIWILENTKC